MSSMRHSVIADVATRFATYLSGVEVRSFSSKIDARHSLNIFRDNVLFEDNHILVVNKPPTVLMQKDITNDTSLLEMAKEYIATKYNKVGQAYLGLVHRIDRPCSGAVVFARTSKAAERLSKSFSERDVDKKYICIVHGHVAKPGRCHHLIGPSSNRTAENKVRVLSVVKGDTSEQKVPKAFAEARLAYTPVLTFAVGSSRETANQSGADGNVRTVLSIDLYTGRKHQIRAQLASIGYPICGDVKYGAPAWSSRQGSEKAGKAASSDPTGSYNGQGIALHAHTLVLPHPVAKTRMRFTAPLPSSWQTHFGTKAVTEIEKAIETAGKR